MLNNEKGEVGNCKTLETSSGVTETREINSSYYPGGKSLKSDSEKFTGNRIIKSKAQGFDPFLSPKEAADYLGVSSRFIYERLATREMPSQPMGRLRRIRLSTLESWLIHQRNGEA